MPLSNRKTRGIKAMFGADQFIYAKGSFGYGLSYTTFEYSEFETTTDGIYQYRDEKR